MMNDGKKAQLEIVHQNIDEEVRALGVDAHLVEEEISEEDGHTNLRSSATSVDKWDIRHTGS